MEFLEEDGRQAGTYSTVQYTIVLALLSGMQQTVSCMRPRWIISLRTGVVSNSAAFTLRYILINIWNLLPLLQAYELPQSPPVISYYVYP